MTIADQTSAPAAVVPFDGSPEIIFNTDSKAAVAGGSLVRFGIPAGRDTIPDGKLPMLVRTDGSAIPGLVLQWDRLATFIDATTGTKSNLGMSARCMLPDALDAAGGTAPSRSYKWQLQTTTRNTTPAVTVAAIQANSDIKVKVRGGTFGADTFTVSLNDILANFTGGTAPQNWGTNPVGGYEITAQGPVCTEGVAWRYLKRDSDGAQHKWVRASFFFSFTRASNGTVDGTVKVRPEHPNILGPHPSGTVGSSTPDLYAGIFDFYNGNTLVTESGRFSGSVGGPNDALTTSGTGLTANGNKLSIALSSAFYYQVTSTGSVPAGLTQGGVYCAVVSGSATALYNTRNDAVDSINGQSNNLVPITDGGTGTVTFTVLGAVAHGCGFIMRTTDEHGIWLGPTARPAIVDRARDILTFTRSSRASFPLDPATTTNNPGASFGPVGRPNAQATEWDINTTGDGPGDKRIAKINVLDSLWIFRQQDISLATQVRAQAHSWADFQCHYIDETCGRRPVGNGKSYPGLGASRSTMNFQLGQGNGGFIGSRSNGYVYRYGSPVDGSHLPIFGTYSFTHYGDDIYNELMLDQEGALAMQFGRDATGPSGTTYYSISTQTSQQVRGIGWSTHSLGSVRAFTPDQHPEKAFHTDRYNDSAAYYADRAQNNHANMKALGIVLPTDVGDQGVATQIYMYHIMQGAITFQIWLDLNPNWKVGWLASGANWHKWFMAEFGGRMAEIGVAVPTWFANQAQKSTDYSLSKVWPDIATMWANFKIANAYTNYPTRAYGEPDYWRYVLGSACFPEDGTGTVLWSGATSRNNDPTNWPTFAQMWIEMADICGLPNARAVRERYRARQARNGGCNHNDYPQFSVRSFAA